MWGEQEEISTLSRLYWRDHEGSEWLWVCFACDITTTSINHYSTHAINQRAAVGRRRSKFSTTCLTVMLAMGLMLLRSRRSASEVSSSTRGPTSRSGSGKSPCPRSVSQTLSTTR